ncbi:hypothetical protein ACIPSX_15035 [Pectobacterium sp. CHL-2024]|uniref:hypothetical protein n=1 Tax=Pectobacterium TaxID=122277 RepID=UPI00300E4538
MLTKDKLIMAVEEKHDNVIFRHELSSLGSASRITEVLRDLVNSGFLLHLGFGIYGKNKNHTNYKEKSNKNFYVSLLRDVFKKLDIHINEVFFDNDDEYPILFVDVASYNTSRKLNFDKIPVFYVHGKDLSRLKDNVTGYYLDGIKKLPRCNVGYLVKKIASANGIKYQRNGLDDFAESITRLAGDDITFDLVEKLLVLLNKKEIIDGTQMARLLTNYTKEEANVRSIR